MKNKGIIITLIVFLIIIIALLIAFLIACLTGKINFKNGFHFGSRKSNQIIYEEKYNLEDINYISIKQDAGDVIFEPSNDNIIRTQVYGEDKENASISVNDGKINIEYKNKGGFFNFNNVSGDIKIYIPSNYMGDIKIKNDAGEVKICDLENATFDIDCDAGNVETGKIKDATVKCDYGNIEINSILNKCNIKADCGNIKIDEIEIKENSSIKADMGNVNIKKVNDIYIEADVDLGKCNIEKNNRSSNITLKIDCDLGNVNVDK